MPRTSLVSLTILGLMAATIGGCDGGGGDEPDASLVDAGTLGGTFEVGGGEFFAIEIDPAAGLVPDPQPDPAEELTADATAAVERAPEWIRERLTETLAALAEEDQDTLAAPILDAEAPLVDEVAWATAVTHPAMLEWMIANGSAQLFGANAQAIYAVDGTFEYASLVELEDRTTLELVGDSGAYEIDPDLYYWYVVYPRGYFEQPAYFSGEFWRELFTEDTIFAPSLLGPDGVEGATTVYDAAYAVGEWIQSFMTFGYGTNQHNPVDIYMSGFGSCGQYEIITSAAARTVLIPTVGVVAAADDHAWNEFWDDRWVMWDNSLGEIEGTGNPEHPYLDWPNIFDADVASGSGVLGEVAHVLQFRADEAITPTDLYTTYEEVTVTVTDAAGEPLEGARVIAYQGESMATWAYTDQLGEAWFLLGDDLTYGFAVGHGVLGAQPPTGVGVTVFAGEGGGPYVAELIYEAALPRLLTDRGPGPGEGLHVEVDFAVLETEQHRLNAITGGWGDDVRYREAFPGGVIDVFAVDAAGYAALAAGEAFDAYGPVLAAEQGTATFELAPDREWYVVLDNSWWMRSDKRVSAQVGLWR